MAHGSWLMTHHSSLITHGPWPMAHGSNQHDWRSTSRADGSEGCCFQGAAKEEAAKEMTEDV
eukprot:scaffold6768_cov57-Phaeocystis_antarctica.AAC.2